MTRALAANLDVRVGSTGLVEIVTVDRDGEVTRLCFDSESAIWIAHKLLGCAANVDATIVKGAN